MVRSKQCMLHLTPGYRRDEDEDEDVLQTKLTFDTPKVSNKRHRYFRDRGLSLVKAF